MSLLDERGTGAISWQRNLAVLWCGVFFACASYTTVSYTHLDVYKRQILGGSDGTFDLFGESIGQENANIEIALLETVEQGKEFFALLQQKHVISHIQFLNIEFYVVHLIIVYYNSF